MAVMACQVAERVQKGKDSIFLVHGRAVDSTEVARYYKRRAEYRKGESMEAVVARGAPSTAPGAVQCFTPLLSSLAMPNTLRIPEQLLTILRDYHTGSFEKGTWVLDKNANDCYTTKAHNKSRCLLNKLTNDCMLALDLFERKQAVEAGHALISAFSGIQAIVMGECPDTLQRIFDVFLHFFQMARVEIAFSILRQFSAMTQNIHGKDHPLKIVCEMLLAIYQTANTYSLDTLARCIQVVYDSFRGIAGPLNLTTVNANFALHSILANNGCGSQEIAIQRLLQEFESSLGIDHERTTLVRLHLIYEYMRWQKFVEARNLAESIVNVTESEILRCRGLRVLATTRYELGEKLEAEDNLREAICVAIVEGCPLDCNLHLMTLRLEDWLTSRGDLDGAAEQRAWRLKYQSSTFVQPI